MNQHFFKSGVFFSLKSLEKLTQGICPVFGNVHIFQKRFQISSSLKKGMERHGVMPPALLMAGGPAAAGGAGQCLQQDWGGWLHSQGHCWGLQHHPCFADSEAAYLQRCHPCPGRRPALKAEGEVSVTRGVCQYSDTLHIQTPQNWGSGAALPQLRAAGAGCSQRHHRPEELSKHLVSPAPTSLSTLHQILFLGRPKNTNREMLQ